ncbi:MAG: FKBP-type peptidyl-prolyl cis-trans isomerase [Chitinophagaceae bacterium]|nr:FKBP-type peptidyl-prolyl cis-trans isomerase [Chitinophagaceae bacterium]
MNRSFYLAAILLIFTAGCKDTSFKKSTNGLEYRIFGGDGNPIKMGDAFQFIAVAYYKDSLISTPFDTIKQVQMMDSTSLPPAYVKIFSQAKKGDSIITRILADTLIKYGQAPPYAKKGQYLGFRIKIFDIITDKAMAESLKKKSMQQLMQTDSMMKQTQKLTDDKILSDIVAKDNIKAVKTARGVYVEIKEPGQGMAIDTGKVVTINYRGMTLDGKEFDKSYDSTGKPVHPFTFAVGQQGAIEGMGEAITLFKKGGKGTIYIPSVLAYGSRGAGVAIKPNESIKFDIDVVDVKTALEYKKEIEIQNKAMQQLQNANHNGNPQTQPQMQQK